MPLTDAQLPAIKAALSTDPLYAEAWAAGNDSELVRLLNLDAAGPHVVWRDVPIETIMGLVTYANMTVTAPLPTTPDLAVQLRVMRELVCQGKQLSLQNLTLGRTVAPMKRANYRAALQDCLTNLPAANDVSNTPANWMTAANWVGVRDAAKFPATNAEKLYAVGTGTTQSPADLVFEGTVSESDVIRAKRLP